MASGSSGSAALTHDMALVESRALPSGVMLLTYRPAGRLTFDTAE